MYADDISNIFYTIFIILQLLFHIDRIIHIFMRLCLPVSTHPKLMDVLPSSASELDYPLVAIQLPMFNEIECCESVIECACNMNWPKTRLIIQVLDDSTDPQTRAIADNCVQKWIDRNIQIKVYRRPTRKGFKAGNLLAGMPFIENVEYIAIFDADFLPTNDFLLKTVPNLIQNSNIAYVQTRWTFVNAKETLLTRMQEILLNFYHKCEQDGRYRASLYFPFNGTGGVWRTLAIKQSGNWHTDTIVEDMDLSLRAYLNGWHAVYMHDVECLGELPSTLYGYFSQQHRWTSGSIQLAKKLAFNIYQSKHVSLFRKFFCLWYLIRSSTNVLTIISLLVIIPLSICQKEPNIKVVISNWILIMLCLSQCMFTPSKIFLAPLNILFSNGMALHKTFAIISGLFNTRHTREWTVTPKIGSRKKNTHSPTRYYYFYKKNFVMSAYLLFFTYWAFKKQQYFMSIYMFSNSMMYLMLAFSYVGGCRSEQLKKTC